MAGGLQNEPTPSSQISMARERFERDVVRGNVPPYYLVPERIKEGYKVFILPYNAGSCKVSWDEFNDNQWSFEYF